jgi:type IV secretion system protein VirB11
MKNEKILRDYKAEVLEHFKQHYRKMSAKDMNLDFRSVLLLTLGELGITQFSQEEIQFMEDWFNKVHHQNFIENLSVNKSMNEIIFHSHEYIQILYHEKKENIILNGLSADDYQLSFEIFALKNNIAWNFSEPFASFSTTIAGAEFRATLIHHSTSANRSSKIFLRSLNQENPTLELFQVQNNTNAELLSLLKEIVAGKKNVLISGSTGSGKTTFLRALIAEIPEDEHVVILEDTHEIKTLHANQTSFLSQNDLSGKSLKDYCAYALRMSPDRMVVGEMRSTEVVPFMLAMNTGHKGLMSTIHANSCVDALTRIAMLFSLYSETKEIDFSLITKLACKNIDYVVHLENKKILEIARVIGSEGETPFFELIY